MSLYSDIWENVVILEINLLPVSSMKAWSLEHTKENVYSIWENMASVSPFSNRYILGIYCEQWKETILGPNKKRLRFLFPILLIPFSLHLSPAKLAFLPGHSCPTFLPGQLFLIYVNSFSNSTSVFKVSLTPRKNLSFSPLFYPLWIYSSLLSFCLSCV